MPQFRVTLVDFSRAPFVTTDGRFAKMTSFNIERLDIGNLYHLDEAHGGGDVLEIRCSRLHRAGGVVIEAVDPSEETLHKWKEHVVNLALEKAGTL